MGMHRIEFFCDDKHVGNALRGLLGIAIGPPKAVPVINAEVRNGGIKQISRGDMLGMFAAHLKKTHATEVQARDVQAFLASIGRSKTSYSYLIKQAIGAKVLKRMPSTSTQNVVYRVLTLPALPAPAKPNGNGNGKAHATGKGV